MTDKPSSATITPMDTTKAVSIKIDKEVYDRVISQAKKEVRTVKGMVEVFIRRGFGEKI